jgi:hypothetical protein
MLVAVRKTVVHDRISQRRSIGVPHEVDVFALANGCEPLAPGAALAHRIIFRKPLLTEEIA